MISEAVGLTSFPGAAATTGKDMRAFFQHVNINPTSLTFGSQHVGTTSPSQVVTVTNKQTSSLTGITIRTTGDFTQTNNCATTLAANASCAINVRFRPTAVGIRKGKVIVTDSAGTQSAGLTATGS